jgi:class 3 adenylate cyclase
MENPVNGLPPVELSATELENIDQYRRLKETSVLVILFTDIKGFTQMTEEKGEQYSQVMRHLHDDILVSTIEEGHTGLVIKHIGDSVMAVFSEPSTAVAKALKIQTRIHEFNEAHPELENILVRIGLHLGQVAIENKTQMDLFGRHVNRASRVEALADGGQIFLTYPVFDSAKGWLSGQENPNLVWKLHGKYFLKGIESPVEIYEVIDRRLGSPRPPVNARKKRSLLPVGAAAALVLAGIAVTLLAFWFKHTEVWFVKWYPEKTIVDQKTELVLDGAPGQEARRAMTEIPIGKHLLHYDIHWQLKYFMETEIKRGKNFIHPQFAENWLPSLNRRLDYSPQTPSLQAKQDFTYRLYDKNNQRHDNRATIALSITGTPDPWKKDLITFTYTWKIDLNGKTISQNQLSVPNRLSDDQSHEKTTRLYEDAGHYWDMKYFISRGSSELTLGAAYIEYKNK